MNHEKLECYRMSLGVLQSLGQAMRTWPRGHGNLADQAKRAMTSVVLTIAEGNGRYGELERRQFFRISRASAAEVSACVDIMLALGLTGPSQAAEFKSRLRSIYAMLSKMK